MSKNIQATLLLLELFALGISSKTWVCWLLDESWGGTADRNLKRLAAGTPKGKKYNHLCGGWHGHVNHNCCLYLQGPEKGESGETGFLSFERFPTTGLARTYAVNKQVTDSAASATALFAGVKTTNNLLGLDARAKNSVCDSSTNKESSVSSIMTWAQDASKDTGFVTTTCITHATPAALYRVFHDFRA